MQTTANAANARRGKYVRIPLSACKRPQTRPMQDMASMLKRVPNPKQTYEASVRADGAPGGVHHGGALVDEALRAIAAPEV
eukprot:1877009-Alexandrium_andersonii.AAC.1